MQYSSAYSRLVLAALQVMCICGTSYGIQTVNLLPNGGGEIAGDSPTVPAEWFAAAMPAEGLEMSRIAGQGKTGDAYLSISSDADYEQRVSNNWAQKLRFVPRGRLVRVRAWIRTENAEAANVCVQCWGSGGETMLAFASTPVVTGTKDWVQVKSERIVVPAETSEVIVRAALTGKGRADFDNVSLEVVGPEVNKDPGLAATVSGRILRKLPVVRDSMVLAYMPQWEHGNVDNLAVANNDGGVRTLLDWKSPDGKNDSGNVQYLLAMYARGVRSTDKPSKVQVREVFDDWNEIVSWKKRPRTSEQLAAGFDFADGTGWKLFDITSLIERQKAAGENWHGIELRFAAEDGNAEEKKWSGYQFVSREGIGEWEGRRPVLLVVDPSQAAQPEPHRIAATEVPRPTMKTEELLAYLEYLATLPDVKIHSVPGDKSASFEASDAAWKAIEQNQRRDLGPAEAHVRMHELQMPSYERFVADYPLTPEGVTAMSSILAWTYLQAEHKAEAERMAVVASRLAAGSEIELITEINLATYESMLGKPGPAESRLRKVMQRPIPAGDGRQAMDIALIAPSKLADVLRDCKRFDEAEQQYLDVIERGLKWDREHSDKQIGASYAEAAFQGRLQMLKDQDKFDDAAITKLLDEARERVPSAVGELEASIEKMKMQAAAAKPE
jgi:hypothetical protein